MIGVRERWSKVTWYWWYRNKFPLVILYVFILSVSVVCTVLKLSRWILLYCNCFIKLKTSSYLDFNFFFTAREYFLRRIVWGVTSNKLPIKVYMLVRVGVKRRKVMWYLLHVPFVPCRSSFDFYLKLLKVYRFRWTPGIARHKLA